MDSNIHSMFNPINSMLNNICVAVAATGIVTETPFNCSIDTHCHEFTWFQQNIGAAFSSQRFLVANVRCYSNIAQIIVIQCSCHKKINNAHRHSTRRKVDEWVSALIRNVVAIRCVFILCAFRRWIVKIGRISVPQIAFQLHVGQLLDSTTVDCVHEDF